MLRAAVCAFLLALTPGCFVGRFADNEPLDAGAIATLQPGLTTAAQVTAQLGAPNDVVQLGKRSAYLYSHAVEKNAGFLLIIVGLFNEDRRSDRSWLFFDEADVLTHVGTTLAAERATYAMPWNDLYDGQDDGQ